MLQTDNLAEMAAKIIPVLKKHGAEYAGVFGSYARGQARPDSDVDILVRFNPQRRPRGLIAYMRMIYDIEAALSKNVDLVEDKALNRHIRPQVISELKTIYGHSARIELLIIWPKIGHKFSINTVVFGWR